MFASLAKEGILLDQYYAMTHPSEPNYAAVVGGDFFGMAYVIRRMFSPESALTQASKGMTTYTQFLQSSPWFLHLQTYIDWSRM